MSRSIQPPPTVLGRYRIVRRIGAGGMAEVFLAKSSGAEGLEKLLVVKRVLPTFANSPKFVGMFVDEAKVAMRLNHPNIVQVYAFEQVKGEFLLAMEFVDGLDLGRLIAAARQLGERVPYGVCAVIVAEVAKGLDYAHNRRDESGAPMDIVHRDVSPQNVLLSYDGAVKIADFGIARARMLTEETGVIKGKFSYMSPEQASGRRVDRRSDVYSLGVLLCELLMNRVMYPGLAGMEVLEHVRTGRVTRPREVDPSVPLGLDEICARATALDADDRLQSCREFAAQLSQWLHSQEQLHDLDELQLAMSQLAPRDHALLPSRREAERPISAPSGSFSGGAREIRERRSVHVVAGVLRASRELGEADASALILAARVLGDIAFKYDAILEWPEPRRTFRFLLGVARVSVDDPLHAMRLALDVIDALEALVQDAPFRISASMGLSRGVALISRQLRDAEAQGGTQPPRIRHEPVGNVFEVAEHLARSGGAHDVLATGEVYRLARRVYGFEEDDTREVLVSASTQATPRGVRAYRLRGAKTREERARAARALVSEVALFGRAHEVEALVVTFTEAVRAHRSAYVAICGELGVGKTALVSAALSRLEPDPRLLRIDCILGTSEVPYAAVAELLREACRIPEHASYDEIRALLRESVTTLIDQEDKRERIITVLEPILIPSTGMRELGLGDPGVATTQALRSLLGALGQQGPTVLWIDALQFADGASLDLLGRLISETYDVPLLVVLCTRRSERVETMIRGIARLDLRELSEDDRRALVCARLGTTQLPKDLIQSIVHRAGGNPFFILELIEALLERNVLRIEGDGDARQVVQQTGAPFVLPSTLEDVIAARIGELPDEERIALRWLAVGGEQLKASELSEMAIHPLESATDSLEERGLISRNANGNLAFSSAMIRHVAYKSIDGGDRAVMHQRVAEWLSAQPIAVAPAHIAQHLELAGAPAEAASAWIAAARAARSVYSNRDALRFLKRAFSLLPEGSKARFPAHELNEQMLRAMGHRPAQRNELQSMLQIAERSQDPRLLGIALSRMARRDLDLGRFARVSGTLRKALDAARDADDRGTEIEALRLMGHYRRDQGDVLGALESLDRALERCGFEPEYLSARGLTLVQQAILLWRLGNVPPSIDAAAEAVVLFRRIGHKAYEAHALSALGVALCAQGAFEDAIVVVRHSILLDREVGDRVHLGRKTSNLGRMYADLGIPGRARPLLERALELFSRSDDEHGRAETLIELARHHVELEGDLDGAERALEDARAIAEGLGDPHILAQECLARATLHQARDEDGEAERAAHDAVGYARTATATSLELLASAMRAEALVRMGKEDDARRIAEQVQNDSRVPHALEDGERVKLRLALTWKMLGEPAMARAALLDARERVDAHLALLRDEEFRASYSQSQVVRAIRAAVEELI